MPSLLAVAAVHHHLIRDGLRTEVGLVVETGEARSASFLLLAGYGAEAINPYLAFEALVRTLRRRARRGGGGRGAKRYIKAVAKGILKVMSKMGISHVSKPIAARRSSTRSGSTTRSSRNTSPARPRRIDGVGLDARSPKRRCSAMSTHIRPRRSRKRSDLDVGGEYQWRARGKRTSSAADVIAKLQHSDRDQQPRRIPQVLPVDR